MTASSTEGVGVPKRAPFSDNAEPAAWLEIHEPTEEIIDAVLLKPDGGEPGVKYEPLYRAPSATTRDEAELAESIMALLRDFENKSLHGASEALVRETLMNLRTLAELAANALRGVK